MVMNKKDKVIKNLEFKGLRTKGTCVIAIFDFIIKSGKLGSLGMIVDYEEPDLCDRFFEECAYSEISLNDKHILSDVEAKYLLQDYGCIYTDNNSTYFRIETIIKQNDKKYHQYFNITAINYFMINYVRNCLRKQKIPYVYDYFPSHDICAEIIDINSNILVEKVYIPDISFKQRVFNKRGHTSCYFLCNLPDRDIIIYTLMENKLIMNKIENPNITYIPMSEINQKTCEEICISLNIGNIILYTSDFPKGDNIIHYYKPENTKSTITTEKIYLGKMLGLPEKLCIAKIDLATEIKLTRLIGNIIKG